jgi:alpha-tubulin suppressor-like RCC1 family protein
VGAPSGKNFVEIVGSEEGFVALRSDGTTAAWGNVPSEALGISNVVSIKAGRLHFIFLRKNGTTTATGMLII